MKTSSHLLMNNSFTGDLGCRHRGIPHDMMYVAENPQVKWERCKICGKVFKWKKGNKGRVENLKYLKAHLRNFCQRYGATRRIYHKIYRPKDCIIKI